MIIDRKLFQNHQKNFQLQKHIISLKTATIHFQAVFENCSGISFGITPCAQASTPSISKTVYYKSPCACVHMCLCAVFINIAHVHTGTQAHGHTGTQACTQAHRHPHYTVLLLDGVSLCAGCAVLFSLFCFSVVAGIRLPIGDYDERNV